MFQADTQQAFTLSDLISLPPSLTPPAIVERVSANDNSISLAFRRAHTNLEDIMQELREGVLRDGLFGRLFNSSEASRGTPSISMAELRSMLEAMAQQSPAFAGRLTGASISEREMLGVLRTASPADRMAFARALFERRPADAEAQQFCDSKADNVLRQMPFAERLQLACECRSKLTETRSVQSLCSILRWCTDLGALVALVQGVGEEDILRSGSSELRELVSLADLGAGLRAIELPSRLAEDGNCDTADGDCNRLEASLAARLGYITASRFATTETAAAFARCLKDDLELLAEYRSAGHAAGELQAFANMLLKKADLECRFAIRLSCEKPDAQTEGAQWSERMLQDVEAAFKLLPEGLLLTTPKLEEIQIVSDLGQYVLGARFPDGVIRVCSCTVGHVFVSLSYGGVSSLEHTLIHEIGHGMQLGERPENFVQDGNSRMTVSPGDVRFDFAEYMRISGWTVVDPARYEFTTLGLAVKLEGREMPVGSPVVFEGKAVIFSVFARQLFVHDALAEFTLVPYSQTSPWEDWAEAFAEYYLLPERLIQFAPAKYQFFEQEFGRYQGREDLSRQLAERMKSDSATPSAEPRNLLARKP